MKPIEELLKSLVRPEVLEFGLVTHRLPSVNIGGKYEPVDDHAPTTEAVLQMLVAMGGSRHVQQLSERPIQWTIQLDGVGMIAVAAILRQDVIQARFTLARRDAQPAPSPRWSPPPPRPSVPVPPRPTPFAGSKATRPGFRAVSGSPDGAVAPVATPSSVQPIADTEGVAAPDASAVVEPPRRARATDRLRPYVYEDDEPTLQTISLPVSPSASPGSKPSAEAQLRPKEENGARAASYAQSGDTKPADVDTAVGPVPLATGSERTLPGGPPTAVRAASSFGEPAFAGDDERRSVAVTLDSILSTAVGSRASDVHVTGGRPLFVRVTGELLPRSPPLEPEWVERIVQEVVPARLQSSLETDGSCEFAIDHPRHGRFRVGASRHRLGYKLSMRVIARELPTLASLGLLDAVRGVMTFARGLVLVTGPIGQGKTSTMAAIVDLLNRETAQHILTIEAPVEFVHARSRALVSQREVGLHARSTSAALRAALREDPDVIVVGELRDAETVRLALAACETGCVVIATMSTPSAARAADRLIDLFPLAEQPHVRARVAAALRLVVGQRFVPSADRTRLHAAVEVLTASIALYTLIRDARTFQVSSLRSRGVIPFDESLANLVRTQKVTLDIGKQYAESPAELEGRVMRNAIAVHPKND